MNPDDLTKVVLHSKKLLPTVGSQKIGDVDGILTVEEDDNFLDPLQYKDEVKHIARQKHHYNPFCYSNTLLTNCTVWYACKNISALTITGVP